MIGSARPAAKPKVVGEKSAFHQLLLSNCKNALSSRSPTDGSANPNRSVETITRIATAIIAGAATPTLIGLASVRWTKGIRQELPHWRNGLGLASIVIISAFWLFQMMRWLMLWMNRDLTAPFGDLREFELLLPAFFVYPALLLACALKGSPRLLMIAAWVAVLFFPGRSRTHEDQTGR